MAPRNTVEISPDLFVQVQAAASRERRSASDVVAEAVTRYLQRQRLEDLAEYGQEQAKRLGLTEADLPRLIAESRQEAARDRH